MDLLVDIYKDNITGRLFMVDKDSQAVYALDMFKSGLGTLGTFADWVNLAKAVLPTVNTIISGGKDGQYQQVASNVSIPYEQFQVQIDAMRVSQQQQQESNRNMMVLIGGGIAIFVLFFIGYMVIKN